ncbi:hypothetical protein [Microcoleus sp. herbarium12]|jgi:Spy/CpxP family protein refolding chaperone|uniref:hypothetical protein n=1 Tax=Microcoleus sp. herbarium12 TaxID=3055437 RepID=UPI002FD15A98
MTRSTIAPAFILAGALLVGGLSACAPSNTPEASETSPAKANPVSSSETKANATASKDAKSDTAATNPATSSEKPDVTASKDAKSDVVAANSTDSKKPKMSDAERAQKRKEVSEKLSKVLTLEQYKSLNTKLKSGEKMRQALTEINLTAEQKPKVKAILKEAYPRAAQNVGKSSETKPQ